MTQTTPAAEYLAGARNADLGHLAKMLEAQQTRKLDVVVPAKFIRGEAGNLVVADAPVVITDEGVSDPNGTYAPLAMAETDIAGKLGIPAGYLAKARQLNVPVWDANVNGWLTHEQYRSKSYLIRSFDAGTDQPRTMRAMLSDSFRPIEHLDVLYTMLESIRETGTTVAVMPGGCNLTDRRMSVRLFCPDVLAMAPELVKGYRSPFGPEGLARAGRGRDLGLGTDAQGRPIVYAGFRLDNSETGEGKYRITPEITIQVCSNGMTVPGLAVEAVHVGGKLTPGLINWSDATQEKNLALIKSMTKDAITTFLAPGFLQAQVNRMETLAGSAVTEPAKAVEVIGKRLAYSESERAGILDHFLSAQPIGQRTAGGLANAITSYVQVIENADRANDLQDTALKALELAAANAF